jgi:peptidoglycan/xylan/chitin deacetylase (PgdA/CDA1 family)
VDVLRSRRELLTAAALAGAGAAAYLGLREDAAETTATVAEAAASAAPLPGDRRLGVRRVIWSVPNDKSLVGLTFDDGPTLRYTPRVLEILRAARVTATFNVVGARALANPGLLREIVAAGHEIGNHTHHHQDLSAVNARQARIEIVSARDAIEQCVQAPVTLFRPPRGELTGTAARLTAELGMDVLMWSLTRDVPGVGHVDTITRSITSRVAAGDILLFHDGLGHAGFTAGSPMVHMLQRQRDVEIRALPGILQRVAALGLRAVGATTLLRAQAETRPA